MQFFASDLKQTLQHKFSADQKKYIPMFKKGTNLATKLNVPNQYLLGNSSHIPL